MYESPITMYMSEIQQQIEKQQEDQVMLTVNQSIGYQVDKDELIKVLQYDREQYIKGYSDCKTEMIDKVKKARGEIENINEVVHDGQNHYYKDCAETKKEVLAILDKLIESEG